jgi:RNA polymerase sigma factor (TIGR02999 family)
MLAANHGGPYREKVAPVAETLPPANGSGPTSRTRPEPIWEPMSNADEITRLLAIVREGDSAALDELFSLVYEELRALSHAQRARWGGDYTLHTTALVHEAYVKMVGQQARNWQDRAHFLGVASRAMRQILVNYAERRCAQKRGGDVETIPLEDANPVGPEVAEELLALNHALDRLAQIDERRHRVVEYRFFAGLTIDETAELLGISSATVSRDWTLASAWLRRELSVAGFDSAQPEPPS